MKLVRKLEVGSACVAIPLLLELLPASRVLRWIARITPHADEPVPAERLAYHVDRLLQRAPSVWHYTCLRRAAVLSALLRREGITAHVAIGVRRTPQGRVEAHAWVRRDDGTPYLEEGQAGEYTEMK